MWRRVFIELSKLAPGSSIHERKDIARNLSYGRGGDVDEVDAVGVGARQRKDPLEIDIKRLVDFLNTKELSSKKVTF